MANFWENAKGFSASASAFMPLRRPSSVPTVVADARRFLAYDPNYADDAGGGT